MASNQVQSASTELAQFDFTGEDASKPIINPATANYGPALDLRGFSLPGFTVVQQPGDAIKDKPSVPKKVKKAISTPTSEDDEQVKPKKGPKTNFKSDLVQPRGVTLKKGDITKPVAAAELKFVTPNASGGYDAKTTTGNILMSDGKVIKKVKDIKPVEEAPTSSLLSYKGSAIELIEDPTAFTDLTNNPSYTLEDYEDLKGDKVNDKVPVGVMIPCHLLGQDIGTLTRDGRDLLVIGEYRDYGFVPTYVVRSRVNPKGARFTYYN